MVETASRFDTVNKIIDNVYVSTCVVRSLSATIAQEIEVYAELLREHGDVYNQCAGLIKAAQIIRDNSTEREL